MGGVYKIFNSDDILNVTSIEQGYIKVSITPQASERC